MIVIIGAGPAGLYTAYRMKYKDEIIVFEKSSRIGGRAATEKWHGSLIYPGAAHIMPDNEQLLNLCSELNIPLRKRELIIECEDEKIVEKGIKLIENYRGPDITIEELLNKSNIDVEKFLINFGYTDMLRETVSDTVKSFGLREFKTGNEIYVTDFNLIWRELSKGINIKLNTAAWIESYESGVYKIGYGNKIIEANEVYVCTDLDAAIQITKKVTTLPFTKALFTNTFAKLFVQIKHDNKISNSKLKMHHKSGPFQRVLEENNRIITIYCDNQCAVDLPLYSTNYDLIEKELSRIIERDIQVLDTKLFFWPIGTHSWTDSKTNRSPKVGPNLYVLGELNSDKQGWIEGVIDIINRL